MQRDIVLDIGRKWIQRETQGRRFLARGSRTMNRMGYLINFKGRKIVRGTQCIVLYMYYFISGNMDARSNLGNICSFFHGSQ